MFKLDNWGDVLVLKSPLDKFTEKWYEQVLDLQEEQGLVSCYA
jgi:hypothetical protein